MSDRCPHLRPAAIEPHPSMNLTDLPERMRDLPIGPNGFIVPWFVAILPSGEPEFRAMDPAKWMRAVKGRRCWVCGHHLGVWLTFTIGPMCGINRTTSEPAGHLECARWSARNCPFLARPHMRRREDGLPETIVEASGFGLKRNPGVTLLWTTRSFELFTAERGRLPLITVGPAAAVEWYAEGRPATRAEVEESVRTGLPALEELAQQEAGGMEHLHAAYLRMAELYPKE